MSATDQPRCGAGHYCCDEPDGPPLHDHFLEPATCPSCARAVPGDGDPEATP